MSWRAIKPATAVTIAAINTPINTLLRTSSSLLHKNPPKTISQNLIYCLCYSHNAPKEIQYSLSPTRPFSILPQSVPLSDRSIASFPSDFQVFDEMPHWDENLGKTRFYDLLDLVRFFSMTPNIETARMVHCLVLKLGAFVHLPTSTSLLISYSRAGDFGSSAEIFGEMDCKDVIAWNAMLTVCIEDKKFEVAMDLFMEMRERGEGFDPGTLVISISAVSNTLKLKQGQNLHGLSMKVGMLLDLYLCNSIIDMYAKCGDLDSSLNMFETLEFRDHISWNAVICGCLRNKSPQKSLQYFKKMTNIGIRDDVSLSCTIAASTCLGDLDIGEAIHGWGIKLGYTGPTHISVNNAIISLYSECGHPEAAVVVFRGTVCKDVISWNSMIKGFGLNGLVIEAFDLLYEMQLEMLMQPDGVTVVTIVPLCAEFKLFREGRSVHAYAIRRNLDSSLLVANSLMDFYSKCSSIRTTKNLFNTLPVKDLVSWNTLISGYSQNGYFMEAKSLFNQLVCGCSKCTLSTLLSILPSCCSPESLVFGKLIHTWQLKLGFSNSILAINALMFMYINCGELKSAFSLLACVYDIADTCSWNTLITGCTQNGYFWKVLETFNLMRKYNANHDNITLANVISASGILGLVVEGKLLHSLCFKTFEGTDVHVQNALITMYGQLGETRSANLVFTFSHEHNICSWNCIISALSQNKEGKKALEMFRSLDIEPNEITISSVLSACTQLGLLPHGRQIHAYTFRFNFQTNPYISAALVNMYSNCGRLDNALQVFQNLPNKSVAAWNSIISAHGCHNNSQKTIATFSEMIEYGIKPTKSTFINLLSACSHLGLVNEGQWYYDNMFDKFGVEPETEHQVCMVDILGRSGRLGEAYKFIEKLPNQSEPGVWGALLSACGYYGDLEMGKEVAEILFRLEPDNAGYYVSLFNMYVGAGRWDDAGKLRKKVEQKGLKKPTGVSLIGVSSG